MKRKTLLSICFCLICTVAAYAGGNGESGSGQNGFPTKPIQLICPVRAGGDTDRNTRVIAQHLTEILGVNCVVTNIDGAATVLGMQHVLNAPADGYTIIINNCDAFVPLLLGTTHIDQYKDFKTIGIPFEDNNAALIVNAKSGFKDLRDLVEKSKAKPASIEYGGKIGGITQINGIAMEVQWGTQFKFVDVGNAAAKLTALLGQKTDVITLGYSLAVDYYKTGELVPLCQLSNHCQQVKKKMCAFLALPRQKPGFPLQFLSPCGACGISAAIPGAPRADLCLNLLTLVKQCKK